MKDCTEGIIVKNQVSSASELQDFADLVLAGGQVAAVELEARIKTAEALIFLEQDSCLKGIAAVKNPEQNYTCEGDVVF